MPGDALFHLSVTFALVTGTAAGVLSLLTWEVFRHSVFGRVIFVFSAIMTVYILYHVILMVYQEAWGLPAALESLLYTGLALFAILVVRVERRLGDPDGTTGVRTPWR